MTSRRIRHDPVARGVVLVYASVALLLATPMSVLAGASPYLAAVLLVVGVAALTAATRLCTRSPEEDGEEDGDEDGIGPQVQLEVRRGLAEAERYANQHR